MIWKTVVPSGSVSMVMGGCGQLFPLFNSYLIWLGIRRVGLQTLNQPLTSLMTPDNSSEPHCAQSVSPPSNREQCNPAMSCCEGSVKGGSENITLRYEFTHSK